MAAFRHFDLALLNPAFDSPLVDVLTELEHLRRLKLAGTTPAPVFFQLKRVFHMLESLGSARIEGNHTTLADYVESSLEGTATSGDPLAEITNIEVAMAYVELAVQPGAEVSEHFIRELHALTVRKLVRNDPAAARRADGGGARNPGPYVGEDDRALRSCDGGPAARRA
jgi:Fic family protein